MAMQRMILLPPEMWETRSQASPAPVKTIRNSKDHSFLKNEKQKREPIPIPIVETKITHPSFKTKTKASTNNRFTSLV